MRRRLDIAMSLIGDPTVVFLDEPTTVEYVEKQPTLEETFLAIVEKKE